jgi:hypothetical protein
MIVRATGGSWETATSCRTPDRLVAATISLSKAGLVAVAAALRVLLAARERGAAARPGIAPLLQQRVVELAGDAQHRHQRAFLRARWVEPDFVQPPELAIEARCHEVILQRRCANVMAPPPPTLAAIHLTAPTRYALRTTPRLLGPAPDRRIARGPPVEEPPPSCRLELRSSRKVWVTLPLNVGKDPVSRADQLLVDVQFGADAAKHLGVNTVVFAQRSARPRSLVPTIHPYTVKSRSVEGRYDRPGATATTVNIGRSRPR